MSKTIELKNVRKKYINSRGDTNTTTEKNALENINLKIEKNKIVGLLGVNGAGKSTLMKIISGRVFESSGEVLIEDRIVSDKINENVICMLSDVEPAFNNYMVKTVFEIASHHYKNYDVNYQNKLVDLLDVNVRRVYSKCSKGKKGITNLIIALASKAAITILDETFVSLDAPTRKLVISAIVDEYTDNPRTFIISTHYMNEVSNILEDVIILKNGKVILHDKKNNIETKAFTLSGDYEKMKGILKDKKTVKVKKFGKMAQIDIIDYLEEEVLENLRTNKIDIRVTSLQELFVNLNLKEA